MKLPQWRYKAQLSNTHGIEGKATDVEIGSICSLFQYLCRARVLTEGLLGDGTSYQDQVNSHAGNCAEIRPKDA